MNESASKPRIAVLIPCFNCGSAVLDVIEAVRPQADKILTVNDGSTDNSAQYIQQAQTQQIGWVDNRGKGSALLAGFKELLHDNNWEALVTLDSDGQHTPEDFPKFVTKFQETNADFIVGRRRFEDAEAPWIRRWSNQLSSRLIAFLCRCPVRDIQCGYRLFSRRAIQQLLPLLSSTAYSIETEMLLLATRMDLKIEEVDVECIYRPESSIRSAWRPFTDSYQIAKVVLNHLFQ